VDDIVLWALSVHPEVWQSGWASQKNALPVLASIRNLHHRHRHCRYSALCTSPSARSSFRAVGIAAPLISAARFMVYFAFPSFTHLLRTFRLVWILSAGGGQPLICWHQHIHPSSVAAAAESFRRFRASGDDTACFLWRGALFSRLSRREVGGMFGNASPPLV